MSDEKNGIRKLFNHIEKKSNETIHVAEAVVLEVRKRDKRVKLALLPDLEEIGWVRVLMLNANGNYSSGQLPEVDTTTILLFPRGQRDMAICLAGGVLEAGELGATLGADHDFMLSDKYGNKITMMSGKIKIEGTVVEVNGGTAGVARVGDQVASPFGPLLISTGSTNFNA